MASKNTVAFIKQLRQEEYTQKQVRIITKIPQSTLSRIWNNKTYLDIHPNEYIIDIKLETNKETLNKILELNEIPGGRGISKEDATYIKLLKYLDVDFNDIRKLFYDVSTKKLKNSWHYDRNDILQFNSKLIDIELENYIQLIQ